MLTSSRPIRLIDGTQALAWRINSDTVRIDLENEARMAAERTRLADLARAQARASGKGVKGRRSGGATAPTPVADDDDVGEAKQTQNAVAQPKRGLKIFYGSLHDIESYPCEDGTPELVRDASTCIAGAHGQWIWNGELPCPLSSSPPKRRERARSPSVIGCRALDWNARRCQSWTAES